MSTTNEETEVTLYAKLDDPDALNEAPVIEDHIQLEVRTETGAKIRVRKITPIKGPGVDNGSSYVFTIKQKVPDNSGVPSSLETNQEVDRNFYEHFAGIAHQAIVKRRYSFLGVAPKMNGDVNLALPAVKYEVDQFTVPSTKKKADWIKMDIELDEVLNALKQQSIDTEGMKQKFNLKNLPFHTQDMFSPSHMDSEQKALLEKLWKTEFSQVINQGKEDDASDKLSVDTTDTSMDTSSSNNERDAGLPFSENDNLDTDAGLSPQERSDG